MWGYAVVALIGFLVGKNKDGLSEALKDPEKFMETFKATYKDKKRETFAFLRAAKKRGPEALHEAWTKVKAEVQAEYDRQTAKEKKPGEKKTKK